MVHLRMRHAVTHVRAATTVLLSSVIVVACAVDDGPEGERHGGLGADASADVQDGGAPVDGARDLDVGRDSASLPDGYPPARCIPPCLWKLFQECKVPGVGGPSPAEGECVRSGHWACDPTTGFYMDHGGVYVMGQRCFSAVWDDPCAGGQLAPLCLINREITYFDAAGNLVAEESVSFGAGPTGIQAHVISCGARDEPGAVEYSIDHVSAECAPTANLLPWGLTGDVGSATGSYGISLRECRVGDSDPPSTCVLPVGTSDGAVVTDAALPDSVAAQDGSPPDASEAGGM